MHLFRNSSRAHRDFAECLHSKPFHVGKEKKSQSLNMVAKTPSPPAGGQWVSAEKLAEMEQHKAKWQEVARLAAVSERKHRQKIARVIDAGIQNLTVWDTPPESDPAWVRMRHGTVVILWGQWQHVLRRDVASLGLESVRHGLYDQAIQRMIQVSPVVEAETEQLVPNRPVFVTMLYERSARRASPAPFLYAWPADTWRPAEKPPSKSALSNMAIGAHDDDLNDILYGGRDQMEIYWQSDLVQTSLDSPPLVETKIAPALPASWTQPSVGLASAPSSWTRPTRTEAGAGLAVKTSRALTSVTSSMAPGMARGRAHMRLLLGRLERLQGHRRVV